MSTSHLENYQIIDLYIVRYDRVTVAIGLNRNHALL